MVQGHCIFYRYLRHARPLGLCLEGQTDPHLNKSLVFYRVLFVSQKHRYLRWLGALHKISEKHV